MWQRWFSHCSILQIKLFFRPLAWNTVRQATFLLLPLLCTAAIEDPSQEDPYVLSRTHIASSRLNYQFYLWKSTLDFNLHPSLPPRPLGARIADVATGTAIWLYDLASEVAPSTRLDGLNISLSQAPPTDWLPDNIHLRTWNIFEPPPADLVGVYDVVHVRLVLLVIPNNDAAPVVRNVAKLLKPGGYLQWEELDAFNHTVVRTNHSLSTPAFDEMWHVMHGAGRLEWALRLPQTMDENGFVGSRLYHYNDSLGMLRAHSDVYLLMLEELAGGIEREGRNERAMGLQDLVQRLQGEGLVGAAMAVPKVVAVGRKEASNPDRGYVVGGMYPQASRLQRTEKERRWI